MLKIQDCGRYLAKIQLTRVSYILLQTKRMKSSNNIYHVYTILWHSKMFNFPAQTTLHCDMLKIQNGSRYWAKIHLTRVTQILLQTKRVKSPLLVGLALEEAVLLVEFEKLIGFGGLAMPLTVVVFVDLEELVILAGMSIWLMKWTEASE